jgi:hypothetical protein
MSDAFVGLLLIVRKCVVQTAKQSLLFQYHYTYKFYYLWNPHLVIPTGLIAHECSTNYTTHVTVFTVLFRYSTHRPTQLFLVVALLGDSIFAKDFLLYCSFFCFCFFLGCLANVGNKLTVTLSRFFFKKQKYYLIFKISNTNYSGFNKTWRQSSDSHMKTEKREGELASFMNYSNVCRWPLSRRRRTHACLWIKYRLKCFILHLNTNILTRGSYGNREVFVYEVH